MLTIKNLQKSYTNPGGNVQRDILKNLNLQVNAGESIAIVGPSGSGKTTLLNLIALLDSPDSGTIQFDGNELNPSARKEAFSYRNQKVGIVFQLHHLLPQCTLWENVLVPTIINKDKKAEQRAEELVKRLGLWELKDQYPGELSGGECQRTALVRALINQPVLLLADEPTGSLDGDNASDLADLLLEINKQENISLIIVTHSRELASRMESAYQLIDGQLKSISL
jgi:lipoprotein-releasing system ATP-binding protein